MGQLYQVCTACASCDQSCCCADIGFNYCVVRGECGSPDYGVVDCKALNIQLAWKVPECITTPLAARTLRYRIYDGGTEEALTDPDTIAYGDAYLKEVVSPVDTTCTDELELTREEWATSPEDCDQCTPKVLLLIAWGDEEKLTYCYACQPELCDEPCEGCTVQVDCYTVAKAGEKCGFYWNDPDFTDARRYQQVVLKFWGDRSITWDGEGCPENESYSIGNGEGNPFKQTYSIGGTTIDVFACSDPCAGGSIWRDCEPDSAPVYSPCTTSCVIAEDGGNVASYDDGVNAYGGTRTACDSATPSPAISHGPISLDWDNDSPPPDTFTIILADSNIPEDPPVWTLDPSSTFPLHALWSWTWERTYGEGDGYPFADEDCTVSTTGAWYQDITFSTEITTTDLITAITTDVAIDPDDDETYDVLTEGVMTCGCCYSIDHQAGPTYHTRAYYSEALVRFTNTGGSTILVTWHVNTQATNFPPDPEECGTLCNGVGEVTGTEVESIELEPAAFYDRFLYPDITGNGQRVWIDSVGCEVVP